MKYNSVVEIYVKNCFGCLTEIDNKELTQIKEIDCVERMEVLEEEEDEDNNNSYLEENNKQLESTKYQSGGGGIVVKIIFF